MSRPERAGTAVGGLALREDRPGAVEPASGAHIDAEADRGPARPFAAVDAQSLVRQLHANRVQLRGERRARAAARRARRHQRPTRPLLVLVKRRPAANSGPAADQRARAASGYATPITGPLATPDRLQALRMPW